MKSVPINWHFHIRSTSVSPVQPHHKNHHKVDNDVVDIFRRKHVETISASLVYQVYIVWFRLAPLAAQFSGDEITLSARSLLLDAARL